MSSTLIVFTPPNLKTDLLPALLWWLVLGIGVVALCWYVYWAIRLATALGKKTAALTSKKEQNTSKALAALEALFSRDRLLKAHWSEFDASLVRDADAGTVLTTADAGTFFNEVSLVDQPLRLEFTRHIPGMLTALGIVGTFGGLIGGLAGFERSNLESSIQNLLAGIHSAFAVSFIAILLAVVVTGVERFVCTLLYGKVHTLREHLNRRFNRTLTDGYLKEISDLSGQTTQALKSFSQDLSEAIRQALGELVTQQHTEMMKANALIAEQVQKALEDVMEPAMGRLASAVESAQQQNASSSQEALRDLVTQFGDAMQQTTGKQMDGMMAAIAGSTNTMTVLRDEMGGLLGALQAQMESQQRHSTQQLEALAKHAADQQAALQKELRDFVANTARTMQALQQQMVTQSGASVAGVGAELTRLVSGFQQRQEEALVRLDARMVKMHEAMDAKLTQVVNELGEVTRTGSATMQGAVKQTLQELHAEQAKLIDSTHTDVAAAMQAMAAQTSRVTEASESLSRRLETQGAELHEAVRALISQSQATHGDVAAQQARYATQLTETMAGLNALMTDFDARVGRHRSLVDEMAAALGAARDAAEQIATASSRYSDTQARVDALLEQVTSHTELLQDEVEGLRQFNRQLETTVQAHGLALGKLKFETEQFMEAVTNGVRTYGETVDETMQRYHQVATEGLDQHFGRVDEQLGKAVQMLGGTIGDLDEYLDGLTMRLKKSRAG
jgi:DNA replication protein DnaD